VSLKYKLGYDDSLDVVGVHFFGGLLGSLSIGLFASAAAPAGVNGLFYGGGASQLGRQALANLVVGVYSFSVAWLLAKLIDKTIGFRLKEEDEITGIDQVEHAETAYELLTSGLRGHSSSARPEINTQHRVSAAEAADKDEEKEGAKA
jgi:Amt family ammonium transporter